MSDFGDAFDSLELELRQSPGVVGVGFAPRDAAVSVHVVVNDAAAAEPAQRRAEEATLVHLDDAPVLIDVRVLGAAEGITATFPVASAPSRARPRLLAVIGLPDRWVEVHLALADRRTIGRRQERDDVDAAIKSTLDALAELGYDAPFTPRWSALAGAGHDNAVAVSLLSSDDSTSRYGVAAGATRREAAARATLHALNRHLTRVQDT